MNLISGFIGKFPLIDLQFVVSKDIAILGLLCMLNCLCVEGSRVLELSDRYC